MIKISNVVAEKLLPQKGGDSEKERQLSQIKTAPYLSKLLKRVSSQPSESLHKILKSTEAREFITQYRFFQDLLWQIVDARINNDYQRIMSVASDAISNGSGLHLNPQLRIPRQQQMTNLHRMPGGFFFRQWRL